MPAFHPMQYVHIVMKPRRSSSLALWPPHTEAATAMHRLALRRHRWPLPFSKQSSLLCFLLLLLAFVCATQHSATAAVAHVSASSSSSSSSSPSSPSSSSPSSSSSSSIAVIGAGYAGLTAALELSKLGYSVTVYERLNRVGGRAGYSEYENGTVQFGEGPSWYTMPDLVDAIFARYHAAGRASLYNITLLDPAYRMLLPKGAKMDVPGTCEGLLKAAGSDRLGLTALFREAKEKYDRAIEDWLFRPMVAWSELIDLRLSMAAFQMDMFGSFEAHVKRYIVDTELITALKWPVIFLGVSPRDAPAMYSMISYAIHALGVWVPQGGMTAPALALAEIAREAGVRFELSKEISSFEFDGDVITHVCSSSVDSPSSAVKCNAVAGVVSAADYWWIEQTLLPARLRRYDDGFWQQAVLSPSCLIYDVSFDRDTLDSPLFRDVLLHHTYFFDESLDAYLRAVFEDGSPILDAPSPAFYVSAPYPPAITILVPVSYLHNGTDTPQLHEQILAMALRRMSAHAKLELKPTVHRVYGPREYSRDFHAFRGNAFGLANTLSQSLTLRPSMDSLAKNLAFAGHMTTPGPGFPPAMVSGMVAARLVDSKLQALRQPASSVSWALVLSATVTALLMLAVASLFSFRLPTLSQLECIRLFYQNGRTFFAASTLFSPQNFLDTAAMYALFRVADDCVDIVGVTTEERRAALDEFEAHFWRGMERGYGEAKEHLVLPTVIETCLRLGYERVLFEKFFASMRADAEDINVCSSFEDTLRYIEGSAAVIGEFMLPILFSGRLQHSEIEHDVRESARALGCAFQLTNMIRDVEEDVALNRVYLPGIVSGEAAEIERYMAITDVYYGLADRGVSQLPEAVRDVIALARAMYSAIHDRIREKSYRLEERARVSNAQKLHLATSLLRPSRLARLFVTELLFQSLSFLLPLLPALCVIALAWRPELYAPSSMTYAQFHLYFTLPALAILWSAAFLRYPLSYLRPVLAWTGVLCLVATVYTTPWDNALVWSGLWGYPAGRPLLGVIGTVPLEEYAFFSLETLLVAGFWLAACPQLGVLTQRKAHAGRNVGRLLLLALFALGWRLFPLYMGWILVWAVPVLFVQWEFGAEALMAYARPLALTVGFSTLQLCLLDRFAINDGIWFISPSQQLVPQALTGGVPLEEMTFFFLTSCMCAFGLHLAVLVQQHAYNSWAEGLSIIHTWGWLMRELRAPVRIVITEELVHSIISCGLALAAIQFRCSVTWGWESDLVCLLLGVFITGIPHGALDASFMPRRTMPAYLAMLMLSFAAWWISPTLSFCTFALLSVLHFGEGDVQSLDRWALVHTIGRGGVFLAATKAHPAACLVAFRIILNSDEGALTVLKLLQNLYWLYVACALFSSAMNLRRGGDRMAVYESAVMFALFCMTPPLFAIGIYLNVFHAIRHILRVFRVLHVQKQQAISSAVLYSLPIFVPLFVVIGWRIYAGLTNGSSDTVRAIFVVLSVITAPHAWLVFSVFRNEKLQSKLD